MLGSLAWGGPICKGAQLTAQALQAAPRTAAMLAGLDGTPVADEAEAAKRRAPTAIAPPSQVAPGTAVVGSNAQSFLHPGVPASDPRQKHLTATEAELAQAREGLLDVAGQYAERNAPVAQAAAQRGAQDAVAAADRNVQSIKAGLQATADKWDAGRPIRERYPDLAAKSWGGLMAAALAIPAVVATKGRANMLEAGARLGRDGDGIAAAVADYERSSALDLAVDRTLARQAAFKGRDPTTPMSSTASKRCRQDYGKPRWHCGI